MAVEIESFMIDIATNVDGGSMKALSDFGDMAQGLMSTFGKLIGITGGIYGVGAALQDFVSDAIDLRRVSQYTGQNIEEIGAWVHAMNAAGEKGDYFLGTIKNLSSEIQNMFTGQGSQLAPVFKELGIAIADSDGKLRSMNDILLDIAGKFEQMSGPEAHKWGEMLGLDERMVRFLQQGTVEVRKQLDFQSRMNQVTKEQADQSQRVQQSWGRIKTIWSSISNRLSAAMLPLLESLMLKLEDLSLWLEGHPDVVNGIVAAFGALGFVLSLKLLPALWKLITASKIFAALGGTITAPILLVVAALALLGAVLYYLIDDFLTWREGGESAFTGLWETIDPAIKHIEERLGQLKDALLYLWNDPKQAWDDAINFFSERWKGKSWKEIGKDIIVSFWNGLKAEWDAVVKPFMDGIDVLFRRYFGFSLFGEGDNIIVTMWNGLKAGWARFEKAVSEFKLYDAGKKIGESLKNAVVAVITEASELGKIIYDWIADAITNTDWVGLANTLKDGFWKVMDILKTSIVGVGQFIYGILEGAFGNIAEAILALVKDGANKAYESIKNAPGNALEWLNQTINPWASTPEPPPRDYVLKGAQSGAQVTMNNTQVNAPASTAQAIVNSMAGAVGGAVNSAIGRGGELQNYIVADGVGW